MTVSDADETGVYFDAIEDTYTLNFTIVGNGSVSVKPEQTSYTYGTEITLTATPDSGLVFGGWEEDISGSETPYTLIITNNTFITANFITIEQGLKAWLYPSVLINNFAYSMSYNLTNNLPFGLKVSEAIFYDGSGGKINSTTDPSYLNNNWIGANSSLGISLSFNYGQQVEGYSVEWYCEYNGIEYIITGVYE